MTRTFPGMNPYLEHPEYFPGLHHRLITYLEDDLQAVLPEPFYARSGPRVWTDDGETVFEPDVDILLRPRKPRKPPEVTATVAALADTHPVLLSVTRPPRDSFTEPYLNIYAGKGSDKKLVTSVEILSLFNKRPGNKGRNAFLAKQEEMREAEVNLVEIDLLRGGKHATAVPEDLLRERCSPFDYHVCIVKADQPFDYFVYPFKLEANLPRIAIPLSPGIEMPVIDLQATFTRCYDVAKFENELDYERDAVVPPLTPEQLAWAQERIAANAA